MADFFVCLARNVFEELHSNYGFSSRDGKGCMGVEELVVLAGEKMGKKARDVLRFVTILEENWYDSVESLAKVTLQDLMGLKIPHRFAVALLAEVIFILFTTSLLGFP